LYLYYLYNRATLFGYRACSNFVIDSNLLSFVLAVATARVMKAAAAAVAAAAVY
jgi:hypothetical protein